jgi:hypothetical protein
MLKTRGDKTTGMEKADIAAELETEIRTGPARRGKVTVFHHLRPETTGVDSE